MTQTDIVDSLIEEKSNRGRPPRPGGLDRLHISVSMELSVFWRLHLLDPLTGRIPNGALSSLVERLLREEARKLGYQGK